MSDCFASDRRDCLVNVALVSGGDYDTSPLGGELLSHGQSDPSG